MSLFVQMLAKLYAQKLIGPTVSNRLPRTPNVGTDAPSAPDSVVVPWPERKPGSFQKFKDMQIA